MKGKKSTVSGPFAAILLAFALAATPASSQGSDLAAARRAYERSDYHGAVQILAGQELRTAADGPALLLLTKSYIELGQHDHAIASAQRAVALDPGNSVYHEWLGRAYGEKADRASWFSGLSLAKKTRKELAAAVQLDERNFSAMQALIEFDCSAPGIAGGGEDKALPEIQRIAALDAAEGHYAAGNCRRQKKDFAAADAEFDRALASEPKSADLIYDIGDYAMKRSQPERLLRVAEVGGHASPRDPRGKFYRATALVLQKQHPEEAERLLSEYLQEAPVRTAYPTPAAAHVWLGRLAETRGQTAAAIDEYRMALRFDPKDKFARDALVRLQKR